MEIKAWDRLYVKDYCTAKYRIVDQFVDVDEVLKRDGRCDLIVLTNGYTITPPKTAIEYMLSDGNTVLTPGIIYKVVESYISGSDEVFLFYDLGEEKYETAIYRNAKLFFIGIDSVRALHNMWENVERLEAYTGIIENRKEAFDNLE